MGDPRSNGWVVTWAASLLPNTPVPSCGDGGFAHQTIRMVLPIAKGGDAVRVRLTNRFGAAPLRFASATVAVASGASAVVAGTVRTLTFNGGAEVRVPVRGDVLSDPADLAVDDLAAVAVSLHAAEPTGPPTRSQWYFDDDPEGAPNDLVGQGVTFVAKGDRTTDVDHRSFEPVPFQGFVAAVDVRCSGAVSATVVIGDSLSVNYPTLLAARAVAGCPPTSVVNVAVNGNRLLTPSPCFGGAGVDRFTHDVLRQAGVGTVVALWVNDIGMSGYVHAEDGPGATVLPAPCFAGPEVDAASLIDGWERLIASARAAGVRIVGGTMPPFKGAFYETPGKEQVRRSVNEWIRERAPFDAVVDFETALADGIDPDQIDPALHLGDFLHPNLAGARVMADAAEAVLLTGRRSR